jgi:hypothetical protein
MNFPDFSLPGKAKTKLRFMCKTAQIPGSTIGVVSVPYFGREVKFAGNRTFADWTVTILNDEDFVIRNAFERWMSKINSHSDNNRAPDIESPQSYVEDAFVRHYDKRGLLAKEYKFVDVFPIDLAPIDLDWGNNDAIEEYSVTFAYQYWEATTVT